MKEDVASTEVISGLIQGLGITQLPFWRALLEQDVVQVSPQSDVQRNLRCVRVNVGGVCISREVL